MQLHWDGNNRSLQERNLSAAIGAGVTEETVDHHAIERVAAWLRDLPPPSSPLSEELDPNLIADGKALYQEQCLRCHGGQGPEGYVFEGAELGKVAPLARSAPTRAASTATPPSSPSCRRASSPTIRTTPSSTFEKTEGYANQPLDGLWLRGPYLHNGSVPSLSALLDPPEKRPARFLRGLDVIDVAGGGFVAPDCPPGPPLAEDACHDSAQPGNGNGGHRYGTD